MRLTELVVRQAKLPDKPKKIFDGGGLFLYLTPSGKYWRYRYRYGGKDKVLAIGVYPAITLKMAREAHIKAKIQLQEGKDPAKEKKRRSNQVWSITFERVAQEWYEHKRPEWKNAKHAQQVINTLSQYAFPTLGHLPIDNIPPVMVFDVLKALKDKSETASRVKQRISAVFDFAIQTGRAIHNPAQYAPKIVRGHDQKVLHQPALPITRISEFFTRLAEYNNQKTVLALRLLILTFVRSGELRHGEWSELQGNEWHIPAEKMKAGKPHIVPLSDWALETLKILRELNKYNSPYFVTGNRNKPMSDNTLSNAMIKMGYKGVAVPHGFRAMASGVLNESGLWNADAIERQLAHSDKNAVRAAYNRAEYLEERHRMMQWYSDFLRDKVR